MNSQSEYAVDVRALTVIRGGRVVLDELDVQVPAGAVVGLLGPSGCGKTTLMRSIVGVQVVAGGEIRVLGREAGDPGLRREVAYVTQRPSVYEDLTVRENLQFFARIMRASAQRIEEVVATIGLSDHASSRVSSLSGGQRARVSLATALLGSPRVCVFDEPTVGQDPLLRRELWDRFHQLARDGATLLVSSHVMDEAARCDHLLLMRAGRIIAADAPDALLERTHTGDVEAAFLRLVGEGPGA